MLLLKYAEATKKKLQATRQYILLRMNKKMFAYHSLVALVFATLKLNEMDRYQHLDKFCNDSLPKNVKLCNKVDNFLHK